ncbi:MAG TPA: sigma-54 dependent transcriptional regulator [bacterium]
MGQIQVLVIDDEESLRHMLASFLAKEGFAVAAAATGAEGLALAKATRHAVVLCDVVLPDVDGLALVEQLREVDHHQLILVMSAYGSLETAIEAIRRGARDYLSKPFQPQELLIKVRRLLEEERLREENLRLQRELSGRWAAHAIIGKGAAMERLLAQVGQVANFKTTILITGESGTGKELIARAIHRQSQRRERAFVAVNCSAIPEALLESELFGHVRGAFTSATSHKRGLFEEADGGTLLLDEIAEIPPSLQVKLLRAIQEEEIRRVGDTKTLNVDVRLLAATSKDLAAEVAAGRFREELYYRLNVVNLHLPPLRERAEDVPLLLEHFLAKFAEKLGRKVEGFSTEALAYLLAYPWPGNVRELENRVERAVLLAAGPRITLAEIVPAPAAPAARRAGEFLPDTLSIPESRAALERHLIGRALTECGGNRTRAAKLLEISYRALLMKIQEYGL